MVMMYTYFIRSKEEYDAWVSMSESIMKFLKNAFHDYMDMVALQYQYV